MFYALLYFTSKATPKWRLNTSLSSDIGALLMWYAVTTIQSCDTAVYNVHTSIV